MKSQALHNFDRIWIADGSTLEALFRKLKSLEDLKAAPENQDLGVVKYLRKPVSKLDLSPFPAPSQTFVQLS